MRTCSKILVQKAQFLSGPHYLWWKRIISPCLRDGKAIAIIPCPYLATALKEIRELNQIWSRKERKGHNQVIRKDGLRKSLEEPDLFGPEMKSIQELQCRLLGLRASNWFPCPLPPGKAEINIIYHVGKYAGYQNTWDWLRGGGIVFFDGQTCHRWTVWPDHRMGKGARWLPKGSSSSSSSPYLSLYESI